MSILAVLGLLFTVFELILLARVLLSWFPNVDRYNPLVRALYDVTEPVLRPIRELLPPMAGMDFSPLIVFLAIRMIRIFIGF